LSFLPELGLTPDRIVFELTEQCIPDEAIYQSLRETITHYQSLGFQVAIDDLGDGFSSLRRWADWLPDYVKFDIHFIRGIDSNVTKQQFVRALNQIARDTGATVVAEGIETLDELDVL